MTKLQESGMRKGAVDRQARHVSLHLRHIAGCLMLSLSGMTATCVFADEAGESCSNRPIFENPWPTTPDSARARYTLHQTCASIIRSDARAAISMFKSGIAEQAVAMSLGLGDDDSFGAPEGSMIYEIGTKSWIWQKQERPRMRSNVRCFANALHCLWRLRGMAACTCVPELRQPTLRTC